jgi:hypothetical protein
MASRFRCVLVAILSSHAAIATGAEFTGYAAIASDYVKRGVTQVDVQNRNVFFAEIHGFF